MNIVIDTSVWGRVFRRRHVDETDPYVIAFRHHIQSGDCVHILGNILQELLDGLANPQDVDRLLVLMDPFPLIPTTRETFIEASRLRNLCRRKGVQASPADFLIAAACIENGYPLLTTDGDFTHIAKHCGLVVLKGIQPPPPLAA